MAENQSFNPTEESPDLSLKRVFKIAYPMILTLMSINIMQFADRVFLSNYKLSHFTAVIPAGIFGFTLITVFMGITMYANNLVSQYYGAKRYRYCAKSVWQAIYFGLFFGLLLLAASPFLQNVFDYMQPETVEGGIASIEEIVSLEKKYFIYIIAAGVFNLLNIGSASFFNGIGETKLPMYATIAGNAVNIFLDWVFIYGEFGMPEMGIEGAGLATLIGAASAFLFRIAFFFKKRFRVKYGLLEEMAPNFALMKRLIRFGLPSGLQFFINVSSFNVIILLIGKMGLVHQAAANLAFTIESVAFMPILGLSIGVSILAGQEIGAGRKDNVWTVLKKGVSIAIFYTGSMAVLFIILPDQLTSIFNSGDEAEQFARVQQMAIPLIRIMSLWVLFDMLVILISDILRAAGDTMFLLVTSSLLSVFAMVLPGLLAVLVFDVSNLLYVWGIIIGFIIFMFITVGLRFRSGKWKKHDVIEAG